MMFYKNNKTYDIIYNQVEYGSLDEAQDGGQITRRLTMKTLIDWGF